MGVFYAPVLTMLQFIFSDVTTSSSYADFTFSPFPIFPIRPSSRPPPGVYLVTHSATRADSRASCSYRIVIYTQRWCQIGNSSTGSQQWVSRRSALDIWSTSCRGENFPLWRTSVAAAVTAVNRPRSAICAGGSELSDIIAVVSTNS